MKGLHFFQPHPCHPPLPPTLTYAMFIMVRTRSTSIIMSAGSILVDHNASWNRPLTVLESNQGGREATFGTEPHSFR